ncbi:MAG: phage tail protein [Roseovarius sp.]|uniref:phage tail protein n=1 Tax=Roseovarius sp. TaxID=1486281 RepID=UPI001B54AC21|nr:phage tail protein [Roseovarius sp.]MBQ0750650.1 phage tail protein [Roseovarius sp.]MBQ0809327.1 phage tail protein [Roseovarius sp.]
MMVDKTSTPPHIPSPISQFYFQVTVGAENLWFQEVSGLIADHPTIDDRAGQLSGLSHLKLPSPQKHDNIVLKRGVIAADSAVLDWLPDNLMTAIKTKDLTIALLDDMGKPMWVWQVKKAFPVRMMISDRQPNGNEVAIDSFEIAHGGMTIENV